LNVICDCFYYECQKAGFDEERIVECHGSIHWIQAGTELAPAHEINVEIDEEKFEAKEPLPHLNGRLARPNVLMFGDSEWISVRMYTELNISLSFTFGFIVCFFSFF
jgi:NAD-dependent SIR2 family protein deacetylase